MMPEKPKISVVIPAYNASSTIERAIKSVLAQSCRPAEIVVVDDGSSDDTVRRVLAFADTVKCLTQPNAGPAAARNTGVRASSGDWIALLDSDDAWTANKIAEQLPYTSDPAVGIVHAWATDVDIDRVSRAQVTFDTLWACNTITASSALIRRAAFDQVGGFNEDRSLIAVEDYNLWLRITAAGWKVATCPKALLDYTRSSTSLSTQIERFARAELTNLEDVAARLSLHPDRVERKRTEIMRDYGRALLYHREVDAARPFLVQAMRRKPSPANVAWCAASYWLAARRRLAAAGVSLAALRNG